MPFWKLIGLKILGKILESKIEFLNLLLILLYPICNPFQLQTKKSLFFLSVFNFLNGLENLTMN